MFKILGAALAAFLLTFSVAAAQVIGPSRGGTGTSTVPQTGYVLIGQPDGTYAPRATSSLGFVSGGTVTSVGLIVPTGFTASGSPVTSAGSLELLFASGYGPLRTASSTEWHSFYAAPSSRITAGTGLDWSSNTLNATLADFSTTNLSEGTNEYFTQSRARQALTEGITGIDYDNVTGIFSLTSGYTVPSTTRLAQHDTAYSWGDWSTQGFITDGNTGWDNSYGFITDGNTGWDNSYGFLTEIASSTIRGMFSESVNGLTYSSATGITTLDAGYVVPSTTRMVNADTAYSWGNHAAAGYLTSFTELDPVFAASDAFAVTSTGIANWNTAYGWGNHASAGYITDGNTGWDNTYGFITEAPTTTIRAMFSDTVPGLTYTSSTGVLSLDSGYVVPTTTRLELHDQAYAWGNHASAGYITDGNTNWDNSYGFLTTVDISANTNLTGGAGLTLTGDDMACDTASGTIFGCLAAADWTIFNNKVSSTSIDTLAELETLTSSNIIQSTEMDTLGEIETLIGSQNILLETEIDAGTELAALLDDETGTAGGVVFSTNPLLAGFRSSASSTIDALTVRIGTTTNATSTSVFSALGTFTNAVVNTLLTAVSATFTNLTATNATTTNLYASGLVDLNSATVKQRTYRSFTWPGTPTTTTATNTVPLGRAFVAETWNGAKCSSTSGTAPFSFSDGSNVMNASTTGTANVSTLSLSTNNTFTAGEMRYVNIGALTAAQLTCTVDVTPN